MPDDKQSPPPAARGFGEGYEYVALALAVPVAMLLFGGAGWLVDGWLHTRPLFAIAGGFVGAFAGTTRIYYRVTGADRGGQGRTEADKGGRGRTGRTEWGCGSDCRPPARGWWWWRACSAAGPSRRVAARASG